LYKLQQQLGQSEQLSRATRLLLAKAGKALAAANTLNAALYSDNLKLQHQANQSKIKKPKKRVHPEPNKRFVNVEAVKAAMDAAAAQATQNTKKTTRKAAQKAPTQSYDTSFSSMCNQFQI
jgi:NADPH-dependent glutamate synthase beta subunit-like oxidoreductase